MVLEDNEGKTGYKLVAVKKWEAVSSGKGMKGNEWRWRGDLHSVAPG